MNMAERTYQWLGTRICLIWTQQPVLKEPCLLESCLHPWIIRGPVNLSCRFSHPRQHLLNLDMRFWTIADRGLFQELSKKQWVAADTLNRLPRVSNVLYGCRNVVP